METNNKKAILNEQHELAEEVLDIYSLKVFIILDLLFVPYQKNPIMVISHNRISTLFFL